MEKKTKQNKKKLKESYKMKTSKKSLKINAGDAVTIFEEGLKRRQLKS